MSGPRRPAGCLVLILLGLLPFSTSAEELRLAVASNFKSAMEALVRDFEGLGGHELSVSYGSTGKHYAQIVNGAPFDVFLAADAERPRRLENDGYGVAGSRFTYAIGTLVLWSPRKNHFSDGARALLEGDFRFLAMANPLTAPYGAAAEQTLRRLGVWDELQDCIVRGENIGQAFGYVASGNAELGFVALSQLAGLGEAERGSTWLVPGSLHDPIEQQAILLADRPAAREFFDYLRSESAAAVIRAHGYTLP